MRYGKALGFLFAVLILLATALPATAASEEGNSVEDLWTIVADLFGISDPAGDPSDCVAADDDEILGGMAPNG